MADPNPEYILEDLSFNEQESIVEIVVEKILGFEDAISEYDDHDTEENTSKKNVKIDFVVHDNSVKNNDHNHVIERKNIFPYHEAQLAKGFYELDSPPPKI